MAAIDLGEDEVLIDRFGDVEWVDMEAQYQCTQCQKVLVQHYISNCQHKFCSNCKRILDNGSHRWRCPECAEFITDIGRQDLEFKDKVLKLRVYCPNRKYGCQHSCPFIDLKEHLKGCVRTKEKALLPVLYEGDITAEMVERMLSNQLLELRNEMREQMTEMRKVYDERDKESNRKFREEVDQLKQKMSEMEKKQKDLTVETTKLRNKIIEIQKNQPMRSDSLNPESVSLAVEENKSRILKLEGKTEAYNEMMDSNYRKTNELITQLKKKIKKEFKTKDIKMEQTMSEMKTAQEKEWAETKGRVDQCCVQINHLKEKTEIQKTEIDQMTEAMKKLDEKSNETEVEMTQQVELIKQETHAMAVKIEDNQLSNKRKLQQKLNLETFILLRNPQQMSCFTLATDKCNFQPDFTWKISGLEEKLKQTTFEIKSEAFTWTGYPVQAQTKMEVKQDGDVNVSLCLKEINEGKAFHLKLIPHVYYVLRDRSGNRDTKHRSRSCTYVFTYTFKPSLTFERQLTHKSWLTDPLYNVDDSIVVEVYVEPPSMAQLVHSYDGTLVWAIDNYHKRKEMEKEELLWYQESPYFYTAPNGYRVQVRMLLDRFREYRGQGLTAQPSFLPGEFDADLPLTFPHRTTITLFNRKDPQRNITKTVDQDIKTNKYYLVDMCSDKDIENVIENDTVFFKVTIKPKA